MQLDLTIEECIPRISTYADMLNQRWPVPLSAARLEAAKYKFAHWIQVVLKRDDIEQRFWQMLTALRVEDWFLRSCLINEFSDLVWSWALEPGIDEAQRRFSSLSSLDEVQAVWRRFDRPKYSRVRVQRLRSVIGDVHLCAEIQEQIKARGADTRFPQLLALLGTEAAIATLHELATKFVSHQIGRSSEMYLAFLGQEIDPVTLRQFHPKHYVDLQNSMALAACGDSGGIEDLVFALKTTTEWIESPFKTEPILQSIASRTGPIRSWLQQGIDNGRLEFPGRTPIVRQLA